MLLLLLSIAATTRMRTAASPIRHGDAAVVRVGAGRVAVAACPAVRVGGAGRRVRRASTGVVVAARRVRGDRLAASQAAR